MTFSQPSDKLPDANPQLQRQVSVSESDSTLRAGLMQKGESLARNLTTERHFISKVEVVPEPDVPEIGAVTPEAKMKKAMMVYDPRFLVFEFTWSIVLRKMQVALVNEFMSNFKHGKSLVKQMIMGQGKTTVVGPLLTLMLGTGEYVVTQVGVFSLGFAIHVFVHCPQAYLYLEF